MLRLLFRLDQALYYVQGQVSIRYGGGIHPKHRLMNYHQFFVSNITNEQKVLDIGCGIGALAYSIATKCNAHITGIEISERNITQARTQFPHENIEYIHGDVLTHPWSTLFDVIVMSNVLEHLPNRPEFLQHVTRTVKPKRFLIRVPLFERDWRVPLKKEVGIDYRLDPTHYIEYTQETFAEEMEQANLAITSLEIRWGEIWAQLTPKSS